MQTVAPTSIHCFFKNLFQIDPHNIDQSDTIKTPIANFSLLFKSYPTRICQCSQHTIGQKTPKGVFFIGIAAPNLDRRYERLL